LLRSTVGFSIIATSMRSRNILLIFGFLLFITGMLSLVLILIGANLSILAWIDKPGSPRGIIIRMVMIGGGLILAYLALNPIKDEEEDTTPGQ
jgi:hypothetical protein